MCMEDIRVMRKSQMSAVMVPLTNVSASLFIPRAEKRVALIIPSINGDTLSLWPAPFTTGTNVIVIVGGIDPLVLDIQHHGDLVKGAWFAATGTIPANVGYVECFLDQD